MEELTEVLRTSRHQQMSEAVHWLETRGQVCATILPFGRSLDSESEITAGAILFRPRDCPEASPRMVTVGDLLGVVIRHGERHIVVQTGED